MGGAVKQAGNTTKPGVDLVFSFDGARGTISPKLAAFLAGHRERHGFQVRRTWAIGLSGGAAALAAGFLIHPAVGFIGVFGVAIAAMWSWGESSELGEGLDRAGDVRHALVELLDDIDPRARVRGHVDLAAASERPPYRTRTSPYSRATKADYRHRWFELRAPLVDGGCLALELTTVAKYKSGTAIRRELQLRGRYRLPAGADLPERLGDEELRAPVPRLTGPATVPAGDAARVGWVSLRALRRPDGRCDLVFWGRLEDPDQVPGVLAAIGRRVAGARRIEGGPVQAT